MTRGDKADRLAENCRVKECVEESESGCGKSGGVSEQRRAVETQGVQG